MGDEDRSRAGNEVMETLAALEADDPRLSTAYVRLIETDSTGEPVLLLGVAHDHPSSVHRVRTVVDALDPDVLALEIPDLLVPVLEQHAENGVVRGGEMTAAIDAAETSDVVGIDAPSLRTGRTVVSELAREAESTRTVAAALRHLGQVTGDAVRKRFGLTRTGSSDAAGTEMGQRYDCDPDASAETQAEHEAAHLRRSAALLGALEAPPSIRILDAARERAMRAHLRDLRQSAFVVGVVGYGHLDAIADDL